MRFCSIINATLLPLCVLARPVAAAEAPTYAQAHAVFAKHCLSCHDTENAEGGLVLETHSTILKGGDDGPVFELGHADKSTLVQSIERKAKPFMPPPKKAAKLSDAEIAIVRAWIDAGAPGPKPGETIAAATTQQAPHVAPTTAPRRAIAAMAYTAKGDLLAIARAGTVEIRSAASQAILRTVPPVPSPAEGSAGKKTAGEGIGGTLGGNVNNVIFTPDGATLITAAGQPGVGGEVRFWSIADGASLATLTGHADAIYALAVSPDGSVLATGSYDQKIILWDLPARKKLRELEGHNGAVFSLVFRNDGQVLASASADRTIKLWDVARGKRLDTRPEATRDQFAVLFTPDGQRLLAGGADNRVRFWQISPTAVEGTNALLDVRFAHEGAILRMAISRDGKLLATSADDRTVKVWRVDGFTQRLALGGQPDWPSALVFVSNDKALAVGRLDGSLEFYDLATGKSIAPPAPKPAPKTVLTGLEPRGVQRGQTVRMKLIGKDPADIKAVKTSAPKVTVAPIAGQAVVELAAAADAPLGAFDVSVTSAAGETQAQKFVVDDLPQVEAKRPNPSASQATLATTLPATFGGTLTMRGEAGYFAFDGKAGNGIVADVAARRVGSKAAVVMWLLDSAGRTIASAEDVDGDPILSAALPADGRFYLRLAEQSGAASDEHFYRVSVGDLHVVTGAFPLAVPPERETKVQLLGVNLPADASATVQAGTKGEVAVPFDAARYRPRKPLNVVIGMPEERIASGGTEVPVPGAINSRLAPQHADVFSFGARAGQVLVLETLAARRGSPLDTRIEVLWPDGRPVQRVQLQAVRDSWLNFRGCDAVQLGTRLQNWEEMDLNQYVYMNGEVARLFRMPQGPDSDLLFFGINGKRRGYFDTTATAHALEDKVYIVEPHPPGEKLAPNGLPVFPIYYANDDDERRELGSDSRLLFTALADGEYRVRVSDVRGFGGERYVYRLSIHEAKPDFAVSMVGADPSIPAGSGRSFTIKVDRFDGFEGPVRVDFSAVPKGFEVSTPIIVEAGHTEAKGTIFAAKDAKADPKSGVVKYVASATTGTKPAAELGRPTIAGLVPQLFVQLEPYVEGGVPAATTTTQPSVIEVTPGKLTKAWLRVQRNGFKDRITFDVENLPNGVIVADIGLNGVLIPPDQSERLIYLQCAPWVRPALRPCHARANEAQNPTSPPAWVRVP
jgi:WD40 repeat protein/mono/diheme cytochrome c family protein